MSRKGATTNTPRPARSTPSRRTPGLQYQSNFLQGGGFIQYDWRDSPGGPRSGGNYLAEFSDFSDVRRDAYSFDELHLEVQQYIPFFNRRRVIALRGRILATDPHAEIACHSTCSLHSEVPMICADTAPSASTTIIPSCSTANIVGKCSAASTWRFSWMPGKSLTAGSRSISGAGYRLRLRIPLQRTQRRFSAHRHRI